MKIALKILGYLLLAFVMILSFFSVWALVREHMDAREIAPALGEYIPAGDVEMYVQTRGYRGNPPIVLVHGMAAWSETWRPVIDMLSAEEWYVIAVDMPPFGFSDRPESMDYWRVAGAERLSALLENLDISSAYVVGHSYGSRAVLEFAMRYPEKVRGVVLVDPALSGIYGAPEESPAGALALLEFPPLRYALTATTMTNPLLSRLLLAQFLFDKEDATDEILAVYRAPGNLKHSTRDMGHWIRGFLGGDDVGLSSGPAEYAKLSLPVALIWGEEDTTTPLAQGEQLRGMIEGSVLISMPGVGHIPHIEDPMAFNAALLKALDLIQ